VKHPQIAIPITVQVSSSIYREVAESILEDQPLDHELLNTDWDTMCDRLAAGAEFQRTVQEHIRDRLNTDWRPEVWDFIDVGELEQIALSDRMTETAWLTEAIALSEQHWEAVEHQRRLLQEAEAEERITSQRAINQHLVEQLRAQGYVVYEKPRRRKKR
jgi:hypothetical protein